MEAGGLGRACGRAAGAHGLRGCPGWTAEGPRALATHQALSHSQRLRPHDPGTRDLPQLPLPSSPSPEQTRGWARTHPTKAGGAESPRPRLPGGSTGSWGACSGHGPPGRSQACSAGGSTEHAGRPTPARGGCGFPLGFCHPSGPSCQEQRPALRPIRWPASSVTEEAVICHPGTRPDCRVSVASPSAASVDLQTPPAPAAAPTAASEPPAVER